MRTSDAALLGLGALLSACALVTDLAALETSPAGDAAIDAGDASDASASDVAQEACALTTCGSACVDLTSNGANCGTCGHDCLGGACDGGACVEVQLANGQDSPEDIAVDPSGVYWTNHGGGGTVMKYTFATKQTTTLASSQAQPQAIALDATNVYWANNGANAVMEVPLGGGTPMSRAAAASASRSAARTSAGRSRAPSDS
jgi:hypothetical protein